VLVIKRLGVGNTDKVDVYYGIKRCNPHPSLGLFAAHANVLDLHGLHFLQNSLQLNADF
jgi:hypothetical protein